MNLDESEKEAEATDTTKKLSRKEKKAKQRAEKLAAKAEKQETDVPTADDSKTSSPKEDSEVDAELEPAPVPEIPPTQYSAWEKISPPAKRKKQLATMESGYKEVLALVHSMRENQEVLMHSFQKLPEAVDSVKKLADHSAQQSEILTAMNEQLESGSAGKFNDTLTSMDKTTQLLLERAQRSEERLYSMLRRAQRRIAFMTLLVLLLFLGTAGAILFLAFPDQTQTWLEERGWRESDSVIVLSEQDPETEASISPELTSEPDAEPSDIPETDQTPDEPVLQEAPSLDDETENLPETDEDTENFSDEEDVESEAEEILQDPLPIPPPPKVEPSSATTTD